MPLCEFPASELTLRGRADLRGEVGLIRRTMWRERLPVAVTFHASVVCDPCWLVRQVKEVE